MNGLSAGKMGSEIYWRKVRGIVNENIRVSTVDRPAFGYFENSFEKTQLSTINSTHFQTQTTQKSPASFDTPKNPSKYRYNIFRKRPKLKKRSNSDDNNNLYIPKESNIQTCWRKIKICSYIEQYCANSSLHGLRYLGETHLSLVERFFWLFSFICAFLSATYFILHLYTKWSNSPIIISMSPEPMSFEQFPFPSVTICNMNNAKKSEADRINSGEDDIAKLLLDDICDLKNTTMIPEGVVGSADWNNVLHFMINVSQPCTELLYRCKWHGNISDCQQLFNPTMTDEGMCCNFNTVHRQYLFYNPLEWSEMNITYPFKTIDWKPENGYNASAQPDDQPWRPYGAGSYYGLTMVLDTQIAEYYCSSTASAGFKMLLHSPVETPKIADFGFALSPGKETRIVITPRISTANWSIQKISRKKRRCFFTSERRLKYYRTYTQKNCLLECEANFTQQICDCVQYYMPKSAKTPICGKKDDACANDVRRLMETALYEDEDVVNKLNITETPSCNCLPACFEINYEFAMSQSMLSTKFQVDDFYVKKNLKYFQENMAVVHLYFVDSQFPNYVKSELFGFIDFLSNVGGLLGLFLGFSFLSVVEIIYFMTLRILCRLSRSNNRPVHHNNTSLIQVQPVNTNPKIIYPFSQ